MTNRTCAMRSNDSISARHLVAVGRKTGAGPLVVEPPMSSADIAAHRAASHVRRSAPSAA